MLDTYSLVEGVVSPIIPLTTFSDDSPAMEEFVSIDDLQPFFMEGSENFFSYDSNVRQHPYYQNSQSNENQTATDLFTQSKKGPLPSIYPSKVGHWEGKFGYDPNFKHFFYKVAALNHQNCAPLDHLGFLPKKFGILALTFSCLGSSFYVWAFPIFYKQDYHFLRAK